MIINSDGFIWMEVTENQAIKMFEADVMEIYKHYDDDSQSAVESVEDIREAHKNGLPLVIEVGFTNGKKAPESTASRKPIKDNRKALIVALLAYDKARLGDTVIWGDEEINIKDKLKELNYNDNKYRVDFTVQGSQTFTLEQDQTIEDLENLTVDAYVHDLGVDGYENKTDVGGQVSITGITKLF